jgi:hypothetical protein
MNVTPEDDVPADRQTLNGNFMAPADAVFTDREALIQVMTTAERTANATLSAGVVGMESETNLEKIGDEPRPRSNPVYGAVLADSSPSTKEFSMNSRKIEYEYDAEGRVSSMRLTVSDDPAATRFIYDRGGKRGERHKPSKRRKQAKREKGNHESHEAHE